MTILDNSLCFEVFDMNIVTLDLIVKMVYIILYISFLLLHIKLLPNLL